MRYLRVLANQFDGDMVKMVAAYNAGPGRGEEVRGQVPPYAETQDYVRKVARALLPLQGARASSPSSEPARRRRSDGDDASDGTAATRDDEEFLAAALPGRRAAGRGQGDRGARTTSSAPTSCSPKNEKAQNLLGLTYFKLGLFDRAAEIYELLVRDNPVDPTLRVNLGLVYLKTNALSARVREFETATDLAPEHKKAHNYLGLALAQAGEYGAGARALRARRQSTRWRRRWRAPSPARAFSRPPPAQPRRRRKSRGLEGEEAAPERGGEQVDESPAGVPPLMRRGGRMSRSTWTSLPRASRPRPRRQCWCSRTGETSSGSEGEAASAQGAARRGPDPGGRGPRLGSGGRRAPEAVAVAPAPAADAGMESFDDPSLELPPQPTSATPEEMPRVCPALGRFPEEPPEPTEPERPRLALPSRRRPDAPRPAPAPGAVPAAAGRFEARPWSPTSLRAGGCPCRSPARAPDAVQAPLLDGAGGDGAVAHRCRWAAPFHRAARETVAAGGPAASCSRGWRGWWPSRGSVDWSSRSTKRFRGRIDGQAVRRGRPSRSCGPAGRGRSSWSRRTRAFLADRSGRRVRRTSATSASSPSRSR